MVAATGAALVAMVARITLQSRKLAAAHEAAGDIAGKADRLREKCLAARVEDERAYLAVVAATALPKAEPAEREARAAALQAALAGAALAPLAIAELAKLVAVLAARSLELENANLASDVGCAAEFASAALAAAALNVRVNHRYMKDKATVAAQARDLERYEAEVPPLVKRVRFEVSRALAP